MRFKYKTLLTVSMVLLVITGCFASLKDVYNDAFLVGAAVGSGTRSSLMRHDPQELEVLTREFNCVTAENLMKPEYLQPRPGEFNFEGTDALVTFAERNNMDVVGHVLVWHAQLPNWIFKDDQGKRVSREMLIARMREHIHKVVGRYKGRIKYWDVVNEAVETRTVVDETLPPDEEGNPQKKRIAVYRDSPWRQIIGDDYIELAFRFAHEADPNARLLYNDYNMTIKEKAEFVADMLCGLKAKGMPIHGVGMQGHWHLEYPSMEQLQKAIDIYAAVGVMVSISELDVGILPLVDNYEGADVNKREELRDELNPYANDAPAEVLAQQADKYRDIFEVLLHNRDRIERVTFWGVSDHYSWLNNWPVLDRTAYPLLFDRDFQPKPAYHALQKAVPRSCARNE
jgi:endo-1,4-beta-xylanase